MAILIVNLKLTVLFSLFRFLFAYVNFTGSFMKRKMSGTLSDNEWQQMVQRVVQRMKSNDSKWEQVKERDFRYLNERED